MDVVGLPKIELHLHLDCSLSFQAVQQLDSSVTYADYMQNFVAPPKCGSLVEFLARAPYSLALLQTEPALRLLVRDVFAQLQRDNLLYAELRFAPHFHLEQGLDPAAVVAAVEAETAACCAETGIEASVILCTLRHFTPGQSMQTAELLTQFRGTRVRAMDLAGDETLPLAPHVEAFHYARAHGIPFTAHAGEASEAGGPDSVREVLHALQPRRISHGVRSSEDDTLVQHLVQEGIHLEICPTCNVQIDIYPTYADHPVDRLFRTGVPLNINTDTRTITNVTLNQEYGRMVETFGWTPQHFLDTNLMAVRAAFAPPEVKVALEAKLQAAYAALVSSGE